MNVTVQHIIKFKCTSIYEAGRCSNDSCHAPIMKKANVSTCELNVRVHSKTIPGNLLKYSEVIIFTVSLFSILTTFLRRRQFVIIFTRFSNFYNQRRTSSTIRFRLG